MRDRSNLGSAARVVLLGAAFHSAAGLGPAFANGFAPGVFIATGADAGAVATGDLDGDGDIDLVVLHQGENSIMSLLNDGRGEFSPGASSATGNTPLRCALADFNQDGALDAAVTNIASGTVTIHHGDGRGGFTLVQTIDVGAFPRQIISADVTGDDLTDLIVSSESISGKIANDQVVLVMANLGDGLFQPIDLAPSVTSAQSFVHADLNGDGVRDLVVTRAIGLASSVVWFPGDVMFHFLSFQIIPQLAGVTFAAGADMDADGDVDLIGAAFSDGEVHVALNNGDAQFTSLAPTPAGLSPLAVIAADFDMDGAVDIVVLDRQAKAILLLRNTGGGALRFAGAWATGETPNDLTGADLDGDGDCDVVVASFAEDGVVIHRNLAQERAAADLNGDGFVDGADLATLLAQWGRCEAGCAGDLNHDGIVDGADLAQLLSLWS